MVGGMCNEASGQNEGCHDLDANVSYLVTTRQAQACGIRQALC
jgi:hypothetical protein